MNILEKINRINVLNKIKNHHVVLSETNYYKLKSLGKMGDSFDKVLGELLSKKQMLESDSRVGTRDQTSNIQFYPLKE
jgi:hypothetical protein